MLGCVMVKASKKKVKKAAKKKSSKCSADVQIEVEKRGNKRKKVKNKKSLSKRFSMKEFEDALQTVEEVRGKTLYEHVAEQCFSDSKVLIQVLKKLLPDLKAMGIVGVEFEGALSDEEADKIKQAFLQRFKLIRENK